jgi:hypothetical protein
VDRLEYPAGKEQRLVVYVSSDTGGPLDGDELFRSFAEDATRLDGEGWRVVSTSVLPLRQRGTAGNMFFQSGGQYATKAALSVVFGRV